MTTAQAALGLIFVVMLGAFVWGRWRFDLIAVAGLTAAVACGLVGPDAAFRGFGEPAVVTVAAVLILTRAVSSAGMFDRLAAWAARGAGSAAGQAAALCGLTAAASMVMNNIGALALFLPAALSLARRHGLAPGFFPMSLSYAALLGGMATLIGTPANLLVSGFRAQAAGEGFSFFAFAPVGVPLTVVGVAYLTWRAGLRRRGVDPANDEGPPPVVYDVELTVPPGSALIGRPAAALAEYGRIVLCGVARDGESRFGLVAADWLFCAGDVLLAQADADSLQELAARAGLTADAQPAHPDHVLTEVVVAPNALAQGSCAAALDLEERYGVRLIAAARQGRRFDRRLAQTPLFIGDVLVLRGLADQAATAAAELGCLPLAERAATRAPVAGQTGRPGLALGVFAAAVLVAAFEVAPPAVAFVVGVLALAVSGALPARDLYRGVDWPVIVLLAAMIPLGGALQSTGLAGLLAQTALGLGGGDALTMTALLLAATMALTPLLNNPATVAVMAPIALEVAAGLGISPDPLLMAVAVGASCDFLTPFGHHNNALVMGPGGYRFGDYARLGWGLELLVLFGGTGLIALFWL